MPRSSQPRLPPRDRLLQAAEVLFYQQGITHVSVDMIAERAQSTKMTLYRHFASKEVLVLEWIGLLVEDYGHRFDQLAEQHPNDPVAQLMEFGRFIADSLSSTSQRGCPFTNTLAEIGGQFTEVRDAIIAHKQRQYQRIVALCKQAGASDPQLLAKEVTLLLEGVQVVAQNAGFEDPAGSMLQLLHFRLSNLA